MTTRSGTPAGRHRSAVLTATLETVTLFGLLTWIYVAVVAVTDMGSLNDKLIHWLPLRIDTAGTIGFGLSVLAFLMIDLRRDTFGRWPGGDR